MRLLLPGALLLAGCTGTETETGVSPACVDAPVVNWDNFGKGFVLAQCQGCHASTAPDRYGAPADVTFDTVDDVWARADLVLALATPDDPQMPPAGGSSEADRTRLTWWLTCADEGT